jgi:hypothetical protein
MLGEFYGSPYTDTLLGVGVACLSGMMYFRVKKQTIPYKVCRATVAAAH